jgi:hypothetical protein
MSWWRCVMLVEVCEVVKVRELAEVREGAGCMRLADG